MTADVKTIDWNALHILTPDTPDDAAYIADLHALCLAPIFDLIETENAMLANGQIEDALALLDEKQQRAGDYARACDLVRRNLVALTRLCPERLPALKAQQQDLMDHLQQNAKLIEVIRSLSENLLRKVAQDAQSQSRMSTYGKDGKENQPAPREMSQAVIVSTMM